jgi:alanine transaminase
MVNPPKEGDESYDAYIKEKEGILNELKFKSNLLGTELNKIEGMSTEVPQGAMYAYVKFELPHKKGVDPKAMNEAERLKYEAMRDNEYCMSLLEDTGICVVPGSGFGQMPGTLHFRTTILPPRNEMEDLIRLIKDFHLNYVKKLKEN